MSLPDEVQALFRGLDASMARAMPVLQALPPDEKVKVSTAICAGLALRLTAFGLGPCAQIMQDQVEPTSMAILDMLRDLREDMEKSLETAAKTPPSEKH